ncbi:MAG: hypothetical protein ACEQSR_06130 [Candidatus Methylacidiphilales bacterium]
MITLINLNENKTTYTYFFKFFCTISCQNNSTNIEEEEAEAVSIQDTIIEENAVAPVEEINEEDAEFVKEYATSKYLGIYGFDFNDEVEGNQGSLLIYPESDTSVLFHIEVCIGASSFHLGYTAGRLIVKNDSALYQPAEYESTCKIMFYFKDNEIKLETISGFGECGFAMNVYADATYKLEKKVTPKYYSFGERTKYNFRDFK